MNTSIGVICPRGRVKHADCRVCALDPLRPCHLTPDILEELRRDSHDIPPGTFTPTMLLNCDRQDALLGSGGDHYQDIEAAWNMMRGSMIHARVEQCPAPAGEKEYIREKRLSVSVDTPLGIFSFAGKPDLVVIRRIEDRVAYVKVVDYKTTKDIGHDKLAASDEHQMQINMYAYLVARTLPCVRDDIDAVEIEELEIMYGDMKKTRRFTSAGPLTAKGKMTSRTPKEYETIRLEPIHLLHPSETEAWIIARIAEKVSGRDQLPPMLPVEKRWMCTNCPVADTCMKIAEQEEIHVLE